MSWLAAAEFASAIAPVAGDVLSPGELAPQLDPSTLISDSDSGRVAISVGGLNDEPSLIDSVTGGDFVGNVVLGVTVAVTAGLMLALIKK